MHSDIGVTKSQQVKQVKAVELVEVAYSRTYALAYVGGPFIKELRQSFDESNIIFLSSKKHDRTCDQKNTANITSKKYGSLPRAV